MDATLAERAARIRPIVLQLIAATSLRKAAGRLGVSVGALVNLKSGRTPQEDTLHRMEEAVEREGLVGTREETPEQAVADSAITSALRVLDRTIRSVNGSEAFSPEERRRILVEVIQDEVEDWEGWGWETRPLLDRLREVTRDRE